ncbi:sugar ABC transporter ATP-binding protein [Desulfosporosinus sp. BICA1-9]|uniref:sugar ABC transporter ATP-binding protein n=1 Tax=Desulfosporosinus sp. BICA1-9 TaxID=1531958 RepID=UPI00054BE7AF|nr:sugar ABC transporter ATP-binding protein [Desulfosporosinus sp. BICA1-9]KJS50580.1 MAG: hypothetical protein VR66_02195 [Peptococcaceae bacterium BRH_c23]KJS82847.1 MAG: hypothetical protein JL57_23840 [Desulfosporosinus sp. BICA1-9]
MNEELILEVKGIFKKFPGVQALGGVDFQLRKGEVHAIVGENGAGKSTLMHILGGIHKPDAGEIFINGKKTEFHNPLDAVNSGVSIVFQELSLVNGMSVAENIFPNRQPVRKMGLINFKKLFEDTTEILKTFEETINPSIPVKHLSICQQQVVEILKAISKNPQVLILDEPTSSLSQYETNRLFENIRKLKTKGMSFIYISHHLHEIFEIADRVTVLRDGKYVDTVKVSDIDEAKIINLMVGREVSNQYIKRNARVENNKVVLKVQGLTHKKYFKDISFEIKQGEIVGFAGLVGAGRTEIAKTIFGLEKYEAGSIFVDGRKVIVNSPKDAMNEGIAYTTENRKFEGLFLEMNIKQNCVVPQLESFAKGMTGFLDEHKMEAFSEDYVKKLNIITPSIGQKVRNLSGGNQQKILLSMWLGINPKVLIIDEPTKGVDVGAKSEIYDVLRKLADLGIGIMVISSDLLEVLTLSDRIIVVKDGEIRGVLNNAEATEENIIAYAAGV